MLTLLGEVFFMRSVPRCYKQDKSKVELVVRQLLASKYEKATALEAITKRQPVKIQHTEKVFASVGSKGLVFKNLEVPRLVTVWLLGQ
jgi:hypothetical protein